MIGLMERIGENGSKIVDGTVTYRWSMLGGCLLSACCLHQVSINGERNNEIRIIHSIIRFLRKNGTWKRPRMTRIIRIFLNTDKTDCTDIKKTNGRPITNSTPSSAPSSTPDSNPTPIILYYRKNTIFCPKICTIPQNVVILQAKVASKSVTPSPSQQYNTGCRT